MRHATLNQGYHRNRRRKFHTVSSGSSLSFCFSLNFGPTSCFTQDPCSHSALSLAACPTLLSKGFYAHEYDQLLLGKEQTLLLSSFLEEVTQRVARSGSLSLSLCCPDSLVKNLIIYIYRLWGWSSCHTHTEILSWKGKHRKCMLTDITKDECTKTSQTKKGVSQKVQGRKLNKTKRHKG